MSLAVIRRTGGGGIGPDRGRSWGRRRATRRRRLTLVLLVLSSLTLLTLDVRGFAPLEWVRGGVLSVTGPVAGTATGVLRPAGDAWSGAFEGAELARENDELRRRIEQLQGRLAQDDSAAAELAQLKEALDLPFAGRLQRVTAGVTSGAVADFDDTVQLDKGATAGIAVGMPAVVDAGLVGTVVQVADGRSVVRLISDHSTRVGVTVAGTAARGVLEGRGADHARADSFDVAADVAAGAHLVTAGTPGSRYPPGIPVGTVERVEVDRAAQQQVADVRLAVRPDEVAFVTVLLHRGP